jgi:hypothetical protein
MKHKQDVTNGRRRSAKPLTIQLKKNQLFISNGSGVIHFLMKPCNPVFFFAKKITAQKR